MRSFILHLATGVFVLIANNGFGQTFPVDHFHKVIISPYIQATFIQGDQERVTINSSMVDKAKLHVESKGGTLRIYLDGAKDIPHNQGDKDRGNNHTYPNTSVVATVTYKKLGALSLRGEETFECRSPLSADDFTLNVYGESTVRFAEVHIDNMHTTMYGEGSVDFGTGSINKQSFVCYGEGQINSADISGTQARLIAYGEADFRINVSERIRITSFGQAKLHYKGNPDIVKGLHFGGVEVDRLD